MVFKELYRSAREAALKKRIKGKRGMERQRYQRAIQQIEFEKAKERFHAKKIRHVKEQAQLEQDLRYAKEAAKIETDRRLAELKKGKPQQKGFLAGFDKFLAGTGVAKGTAPVLRKETGGQKGIDIMGSSGLLGSSKSQKKIKII